MSVSNYVIRRYTPPTCTLEVLAQNSALSRWGGKAVLKELRFELRFDDPRLPEDKRVIIQGNHEQLDALCTVVTNYVQELLQKTSDDFWATNSQPQQLRIPPDTFQRQDVNQDSSQSPHILEFHNTHTQGSEIHIAPRNHLIHDLYLGSLANQASGDFVQLSLLQLFDLSTALDEYSADVLALPNLNTNQQTRVLPSWIPVAAVLALALGLAPFTWQYAQNLRQKQQTAKKQTPVADQIALNPSPSIPTPTSSPLLTPPDSLLSQQQPPLPLGSKTPLLSSPVPIAPVPSSKSTFPLVAQNSTLPKTPLSNPKSTTLTIPGTTSQTSALFKTTPPLIPQSPKLSSEPHLAINNTKLNSLPQGKLQVPAQPTLALNNTGLNSLESPPISRQRNLKQSRGDLIAKGGSSQSGSAIPLSNQLSPTSSTQPDISKVPPSVATIPNLSGGDSTNLSNPQLDPSIRRSKNSLLIAKLKGARRKTSTEIATGTLFDTTQVAEARAFLKQRWQPPNELKQTLEYSLVLGVDGSIEKILPLGKAARDYIDRTGMPLIGERFVSPNKNGQPVRIRAVFSPDGKVQTFPETQ